MQKDELISSWGWTFVGSYTRVIKSPLTGNLQIMLVKKAEEALAALLKEFMYLEGSNCPKETEIKGKLKGFKEALQLARLVKEDRFQELFAAAHLEIHGMTSSAKNLAIGVSAQQLTTNDWDKFDTPTVVRRRART